MSTETLSKAKTGMLLKGGMFTLTTLHLQDNNIDDLSQLLEDKIKQAPKFFEYAPVILDVHSLPQETEMADFYLIINTLKSKKLIPIGIRGATKGVKEAAIQIGLAIFPEEKPPMHKKEEAKSEESKEEQNADATFSAASTPTRLITQPVRSGQQIYAPGGDLVVLSSVSHGAELLADGHIHVHGPMRGRALAGVMGNKKAIIYCKSLEAELISIAGQYQISETLKEKYWKQATCIQLEGERLNIQLL